MPAPQWGHKGSRKALTDARRFFWSRGFILTIHSSVRRPHVLREDASLGEMFETRLRKQSPTQKYVIAAPELRLSRPKP
jgi:hypothetical protein